MVASNESILHFYMARVCSVIRNKEASPSTRHIIRNSTKAKGCLAVLECDASAVARRRVARNCTVGEGEHTITQDTSTEVGLIARNRAVDEGERTVKTIDASTEVSLIARNRAVDEGEHAIIK